MTEVDALVRRLAAMLAGEFEGVFARETVDRFVAESYEQLAAAATVHSYLPLLTERFARDRLHALARAQGVTAHAQPEVLFVCVHNAGRSQAAAALMAHHGQGRVQVRSAGSAPAGEIDPAVRAVLAERGIDITREFPKPLTDEIAQASDVIVTMGCGDACPVYPGKRYLDWQLDDPAGRSVDEVRPIVERIERRVLDLLREIEVSAR